MCGDNGRFALTSALDIAVSASGILLEIDDAVLAGGARRVKDGVAGVHNPQLTKSGETRGIVDGNREENPMPPPRDNLRPTIARIWRGRVPRARADEYAAYSLPVGIEPLAEKAL